MANALSVSVHIDSDGFGTAVDELVVKAAEAAQAFVSLGGLVLVAAMQPHTPVETGTLRRSERVDQVSMMGPGVWQSQSGPTVVYGRRLDQGFHGADSLGRHYNQAGTFYVEAGVTDAQGALEALHEKVMAEAVSG